MAESGGGARGPWSQHHPSPPGWTEKSAPGVHEGAQVSATTPPTRTDRYSGTEKSEMREGDQVTKPTSPPPGRTETVGRRSAES